ncbi:MAG: DNA repair protein RecO [Ignavibacteriaceae bacterium]
MSEIVKTEAVVLSKINFRDTSLILSVYTEMYGKMTVIIKGGRNPRSRFGMTADPLNHVQMVIYKKDNRDIQLLSSADIISHYPRIKEDLDKTQYALAIMELIKKLTSENESNKKLFKGLVKILSQLESNREHPGISYERFFMFFLSELGYELQIYNCGFCKKEIGKQSGGFSFETGIVCSECHESHPGLYFLSAELLNHLFCLKNNISVNNIALDLIKQTNIFLERYTKAHIPDFSGVHTLSYYNNSK